MYPYWAMFQAGAVAPSCSFLLQLLTAGGGGLEPAWDGGLLGLHRPELESPVLDGARDGPLP